MYKNSTPESRLLEIERKFDVPVERLYEAFTTPENLKKWWWPEGLFSDRIEMEFREGGRYFINMKGLDFDEAGMTGQFEEIRPRERIVMTDQFANAAGDAISAQQAGMKGDWPELIYITFEFYQMGDAQSGFKLSQQGIPNEAQAECIRGWSESFDKLGTFLGLSRSVANSENLTRSTRAS